MVRPARNISGSLRLPGDKSICHRYAMLGAIAEGTTVLENYSPGADCASTLHCLRGLGVDWKKEGDRVTISGSGPELKQPGEALDCGNSGSTMRMLSGILAGQEFTTELVGDESLSRRPMKRVIDPLQQMGAKIEAIARATAPLHITGGRLGAINYTMPVASAQVKTAILFAGLYADGQTRVEEPVCTRDHGEIALRAFGADVRTAGNEITISGGQKLHAINATIHGDISTAAFFLCAAALFPGSRLIISNLLMNPTRSRLLDVLVVLGARISVSHLEQSHGELTGSVEIEGKLLEGATISGEETAGLIDEIPVLASIAPYTEKGMEIRDARELRVKESDRIAAIARNLRAMGAEVEEREDGLRIPGNQRLLGAEIDCCGDHRIAMAFAIAALRASGKTAIRGADAAAVSCPAFFEMLESITQS